MIPPPPAKIGPPCFLVTGTPRCTHFSFVPSHSSSRFAAGAPPPPLRFGRIHFFCRPYQTRFRCVSVGFSGDFRFFFLILLCPFCKLCGGRDREVLTPPSIGSHFASGPPRGWRSLSSRPSRGFLVTIPRYVPLRRKIRSFLHRPDELPSRNVEVLCAPPTGVVFRV